MILFNECQHVSQLKALVDIINKIQLTWFIKMKIHNEIHFHARLFIEAEHIWIHTFMPADENQNVDQKKEKMSMLNNE